MSKRKKKESIGAADEQVISLPDRATSARSLPAHNWHAHWLTVQEFSRVMGRDPQTVYWWLHNGTLAEFGIPVWQTRCGRLHSGRTFIQNIY